MASIDVARQTLLLDLDESLERLLGSALAGRGLDLAAISFDPPDEGWAQAVARPAVNLFLYDVRGAAGRRTLDWTPDRDDPRRLVAPPLWLRASYAVTAWAAGAREEHSILSQVIATLSSHPTLPAETLVGGLAEAGRAAPECRVAEAVDDRNVKMWSLAGIPKPILRCTLITSLPSGRSTLRGPDARAMHLDIDGTR